MAGHYLRKRLRSTVVARRLACFSGILLVVTILVFRWHGIGFDVLGILLGLVAGGLALALSIALVGLSRVWRSGHEGGRAAVAALFIALVVAAPFALAGYLALENPPTGTAETDGMVVDGEMSGNADAAPIEGAISGRVFSARASQIYQAVRLVLGDVGWTVLDVETADPQEIGGEAAADMGEEAPASLSGAVPVPTPRVAPGGAREGAPEIDPLDRPESGEYRVAAVAAGPILGLPSDIEIRIGEDEAQGYLDLRSTSRFGTHDLGQNRRFIEDFLKRVDAAMIGTTAPAAR